jgi:O-antigen/teichoic acid export membrane protein
MASSLPDTTEWKTDSNLLVSPEPAAASGDPGKPPVASLLGHELKTLARESSHYMAGLLGNLAVGFVSFPIFTRVLSISEYGLMDLGQRLLLMLTIASKLGLQNASLRFYNRQEFFKDAASARDYYSTLFFGMLGSSSSIVLLFLLSVSVLSRTSTLGPLANMIYLILGLVVLRAMGAVLWGFLRIEERTKIFNVVTVATRAATIAAVCALLPWIGRSARTYFTGTFAVETILVLGLTAWLLQRGVLDPSHFKFGLFRAAIAYGTPLVLYEFAFAVLGSADRFLVRHYVGAEALGFYSVAYGLANNVNELLVSPLGLALIPIYMRIWTSDGAEKTSAFLTTAFNLFILAAAGVLAAIAVTGHSIVVLLASAKYAGADRLIPVILAGLLVYGANIFVAAGLLIHKRTMQMSGMLVVAAALNIGLNCLLLPRMGLMGGAIATLLSYLICIVSLAWASNRILPLRTDIRTCAKYVAAAAVAWAAASQFAIRTPLVDLLARSAVVFTIYLVALYFMDRRVRDGIRWGLNWIRVQC